MQKSSFTSIAFLIITALIFISFIGCSGAKEVYDSLSYEKYLEQFAFAYVNKDTTRGEKLKKLYPKFHEKLLDDFATAMTNPAKSRDEQNVATMIYFWAILLK